MPTNNDGVLAPKLDTPVNAPLVNVGLISNPTNTSEFAAATKVGAILVLLAKALAAVTDPVIVNGPVKVVDPVIFKLPVTRNTDPV